MREELIGITENTLRRLPAYLEYLRGLPDHHSPYISGAQIAEGMRLDPALVRRDLEAVGLADRPGARVASLVEALERFLGRNNTSDTFLVGAGNLGTALLARPELRIVAAFDIDARKIGTSIHDREVLSVDKLPDLARRLGVLIGIVAVPPAAAQEAADLLVRGGIRAIWNFAPARLEVPEGVIVEESRLLDGLAALTGRLERMK